MNDTFLSIDQSAGSSLRVKYASGNLVWLYLHIFDLNTCVYLTCIYCLYLFLQERKEALARRSRERTENANVKRRSWSAFGSRDAPSPALSASTPRGRSAERMADRTDRPARPASASSSLGVNKRLSSSMSTVYRPVHLVRLGPNADDWFEVHLPVKDQEADRRSSSPGTDQSSQRQPRHHQSSPNLACKTSHYGLKFSLNLTWHSSTTPIHLCISYKLTLCVLG